MPLPREKWFCVPTFNNLEKRHDLEREAGRAEQTETMMMEDGMRDGEVREGKREETREPKHVTNLT